MEEKTPKCDEMLDFETSKSKSEVSKSNSWKTTPLLQRELYLTMFYTINSSPLLITMLVFMLKIILSNYH